MTLVFGCTLVRNAELNEAIFLEIRSAIDHTAFGIGMGITHEQEGNASVGHLQDDGVLVDVVRKGGDWVEDLYGQARVQVDRVSWWGIKMTSAI